MRLSNDDASAADLLLHIILRNSGFHSLCVLKNSTILLLLLLLLLLSSSSWLLLLAKRRNSLRLLVTRRYRRRGDVNDDTVVTDWKAGCVDIVAADDDAAANEDVVGNATENARNRISDFILFEWV